MQVKRKQIPERKKLRKINNEKSLTKRKSVRLYARWLIEVAGTWYEKWKFQYFAFPFQKTLILNGAAWKSNF